MAEEALIDFCMLALFHGNDYLPKIRNTPSLHLLWRDYQDLRMQGYERLYDPEKHRINIKLLKKTKWMVSHSDHVTTQTNMNGSKSWAILCNVYTQWWKQKMVSSPKHTVQMLPNGHCHFSMTIGDTTWEHTGPDLIRTRSIVSHRALCSEEMLKEFEKNSNADVADSVKKVVIKYIQTSHLDQNHPVPEKLQKEVDNSKKIGLTPRDAASFNPHEAARGYLAGLDWVMQNMQGNTNDYNFCFMQEYMTHQSFDTIDEDYYYVKQSPANLPLNPLQFAMAVLPPHSFQEHIPAKAVEQIFMPPLSLLYKDADGSHREWSRNSLPTIVNELRKMILSPASEGRPVARFSPSYLFRKRLQTDPVNLQYTLPNLNARAASALNMVNFHRNFDVCKLFLTFFSARLLERQAP